MKIGFSSPYVAFARPFAIPVKRDFYATPIVIPSPPAADEESKVPCAGQPL